jgi:hypothetical protein
MSIQKVRNLNIPFGNPGTLWSAKIEVSGDSTNWRVIQSRFSRLFIEPLRSYFPLNFFISSSIRYRTHCRIDRIYHLLCPRPCLLYKKYQERENRVDGI